jgi:hypothetical protein
MSRSRFFGLLISSLAVLLTPGCGGETEDIEAAYGNLTITDEPPQFGEAPIFGEQSLSEADATVTDPVAGQDGYKQAEAAAPRLRYLLLVWGHLKAAGPLAGVVPPGGRDFSGSLTLSEGGAVVARRLRFEPLQKEGLLPRTDIKRIEWRSTIYNAVDGLLVKIAAPDAATVTVSVAGLTMTSTAGELDLAHGKMEIPGTDAFGLAWAGAAASKDAGCEHGFLAGRWARTRLAGGVFRGKWISADGALRGHLKGLFGLRKNGRQVFFGKWIETTGKFRGLLAGNYGENVFRGFYLDRDFTLRGRLHGRYFDPTPLSHDVGVMLGTWHQACATEPIPAGETPEP